MSDKQQDGQMNQGQKKPDKRRVMVTQLLRSPVLNPAGSEVGRVEDFIVKLAEGGGYPPITGLKVASRRVATIAWSKTRATL